MSRLITRMENASARVASRMTKEFVLGTTSATAASATRTTRTLLRTLVISFPPEQSRRLYRQDQGHRRVERKVGHLREQRLAEIIRKPNQQRSDRGAAEATHAADDHHRERNRQHLEVEAGIDAEEGAADHAAQRRQEGAQGKDQHGDERCVDAD